MPTTQPLYESGRGTVASNGKASITLQPLRAFERWHIRKYSIQCVSPLAVGASTPICKVYRGSEDPTRLIEGTFNGTLNSSDTDITLETGEIILAVWTGGDVNAQCSFTLQGEILRGI